MASTDPAPTVRLTLLCCAGTTMARTGGFAGPFEPLDEDGRRRAATLRIDGPAPATILLSPAESATQTAAAMGLDGTTEPSIADMDWGSWCARSFHDIHAEMPDRLARWLADPCAGAPDGETFANLSERAARWIEGLPRSGGRVLAITHPMTIRAILSAAIGLPGEAAMRIDIAPLSITELSYRGGWRVQALGVA